MSAAKKALTIEQRATWTHTLTWKDEKGKAINLTGCVVRMQIRADAASAVLLFELTTANGRITLLPTTGVIKLRIEANDTNTLTFVTAFYDIKVEFPGANGDEFRLMEGSIKVTPGVTV